MSAYDAAAWGEFGVALVGAAAALAGLIFVAISINLREILANPILPGRAAEGLITLFVGLASCGLLLVPEQDAVAFGAEWSVIALCYGGLLLRLQVRARSLYPTGQGSVLRVRIGTHQAVALLLLVSGMTTATHGIGGIYWIAPFALWALAVGIIDGWVILVEILR